MLNPLTWEGFGEWAFIASAFAFLDRKSVV